MAEVLSMVQLPRFHRLLHRLRSRFAKLHNDPREA